MVKRWIGVRALLALAAVSAAALAQQTTGSFLGTIQDGSGAIIPSAVIKAVHVDTQRTYQTTSDPSGGYRMPTLPVGRYDISVEHPGFKRATKTGITLQLAESLAVDFRLEVGSTTETVQVSAQVVRVNTEEGSMSALFGSREIANIPTNGRYFNQLVALMPGTISNIPTGPGRLNFNRAGVSVNGTRYNDNNWSVDGVFAVDTGANQNMNDAAGIETVGEFRILRSNYDAEYGVSGGAQINVVTKSGTREFHGHLQEFFRNNKLDARNFFSAARPGPLRFNNPGFTAGGPLMIPKVYNRDRQKTFFFASLEWQVIRRASPSTATVPTPEMVAGIFPRAIRDPLNNNQNFPNNTIPASRMDPNAVALAKLFPAPNRTGTANNFVIDRRATIDYFSQLARVDHRLTDNHQFMFRGSKNHYQFDDPAGSFEPFRGSRDSSLYTWGATLTSIFGPSMTNEFQVGQTSGDLPGGPPTPLPASQFGVNIPQLFPDTPENYPLEIFRVKEVPNSPPAINITGYAGLPFQQPGNSPTNVWQLREGFSKVTGPHLLKFGGLWHREYKAQPLDSNAVGSFSFNGNQTGDGFADFLIGRAQSYTENDKVNVALVTRKTFEAYINDRWKMTRHLSLSIGVRFSHIGLPVEMNGQFRAFDPASWTPSKAPLVSSSGAITPGTGDPLNGLVETGDWFNNKRNMFAPRFSFSYDPIGQGKTVIRGGYAITTTRESFDIEGLRQLNSNPPFARNVTVFSPLLSNPGAGTAQGPQIANVRAVDPNVRMPYYQQWNIGFEHAIMNDTVLDIAYVGNKGTNLTRSWDINQPNPNADVAASRISANSVRPYLGFGSIIWADTGANSHYNSLQASLNRSYSKGLSYQVSYTWSRAITDARNQMTTRQNFDLDYGPADFDVPHNFVGVVLYELPFLRDSRAWYGQAFGRWQISTIYRAMSGQPIDSGLGRDIAGVGNTNQRAQILRDPRLPKDQRTVNRYFDTTAFAAPEQGTYATTGVGSMRGFGVNNWDISVMKNFALTERMRLEFQADAFNAFNHTQFSGISTGFFNANFGTVTGARTAREMQLGLKMRW
jgi:hypothetical protein